MRNAVDTASFARSIVGFSGSLDQLEAIADPEPGDNLPPYNINKLGNNRYQVARGWVHRPDLAGCLLTLWLERQVA